MKNDTSSASSSPSPRVQKQSIERLRTHADDYAKNFIYVHSPHYRLNCCNGIYGESWDGWTDGRGGRARAAGARMDWVVNVHFDVSEMPSRRHRVALAPLLPHESSSNPPFSSSAGFTPPPPLKRLSRNRCVETAWNSNDGKMGFTVPVAFHATPQHRVPLTANEDELLTRGTAAPSRPRGDKNDLIWDELIWLRGTIMTADELPLQSQVQDIYHHHLFITEEASGADGWYKASLPENQPLVSAFLLKCKGEDLPRPRPPWGSTLQTHYILQPRLLLRNMFPLWTEYKKCPRRQEICISKAQWVVKTKLATWKWKGAHEHRWMAATTWAYNRPLFSRCRCEYSHRWTLSALQICRNLPS